MEKKFVRLKTKKILPMLKEIYKSLPEKKPMEIPAEKWRKEILELAEALEKNAKERNIRSVELCRKKKLSAKQIMELSKGNQPEDPEFQKQLDETSNKYAKTLIKSEPYQFFKKETILTDTRKTINMLIGTIEAKAFFQHLVIYILERLDKIHTEIPQFEERDRREAMQIKTFAKEMQRDSKEFIGKLELARNMIANQISRHIAKEKVALGFGKENTGRLVEKLEKRIMPDADEIRFLLSLASIEEILAKNRQEIQQLQKDYIIVVYGIITKMAREML